MGEFKIKDGTNFTLKSEESEECIDIDYVNDYELDTDNEFCIVDGEDVVIESGKNESEEIIGFDDFVMRECDMSFTFEEIDYKVTIYNIENKYINICPEIVEERCYNIINKLAVEGHKFVNGERIDFEKYLV